MNHKLILAYLIIGCVFMYLLLQSSMHVENYDSAVKYVSGEYAKAYANITCCTCISGGASYNQFADNSLFGNIKPNVSVSG